MDEKKRKAIERMQQEINELKKQIKFVEQLPDDLPGELYAFNACVSITVPYDVNQIRIVRNMLGADYKISGKPFVTNSGEWSSAFYRKDDKNYRHRLHVSANPEKPGSACRRVIDHYEQQPVYKIVCDGASEHD